MHRCRKELENMLKTVKMNSKVWWSVLEYSDVLICNISKC